MAPATSRAAARSDEEDLVQEVESLRAVAEGRARLRRKTPARAHVSGKFRLECSQPEPEGHIVHLAAPSPAASAGIGKLTRDGPRPQDTEDFVWIPDLSNFSVWIPELTPTHGRPHTVLAFLPVRCDSPKSSHSTQESSIRSSSSTAGRSESSPTFEERQVQEYPRIFSQSPSRSGKECDASSPERRDGSSFGRVMKPSLRPRGSPLSEKQRRRLGIDLQSRREEQGMLM